MSDALIRFARQDDAAAVAAIYAPYVATPISFELEPPPASEMARRIGKVLPNLPWLVHERAGAVDAYAYASLHAERAAFRWGVDEVRAVLERIRGLEVAA